MTNSPMPRPVPGAPSAIVPRNSPTDHDASTATSARFGPQRSVSHPQKKLVTIATTVSIRLNSRNWLEVMPIARTASTDMTTMSVLTASL